MKKLFQTLALVSLATAGMIVSSCEVENINTTFEPSPAVATVTVTAYDVTDGGKDISKDVTLTVAENIAGLSISGNVITVTGNPTISATDITIIATRGNDTGMTWVSINPLLAGGIGTYKAYVYVGELPGNYFVNQLSYEKTDEEVGTFVSTHGLTHYQHDYSHATTGHGKGMGNWLYNESEFILNTEVKYDALSGVIGGELELTEACKKGSTDEVMVDYLFSTLIEDIAVPEPKVLPITVSAFSMYSAYGTITYSERTYAIVRHTAGKDLDDVVLAFATIEEASTNAEYCEAAMPGHEGHYIHGHGHDDVHGYSSNAGGGIIWAE